MLIGSRSGVWESMFLTTIDINESPTASITALTLFYHHYS